MSVDEPEFVGDRIVKFLHGRPALTQQSTKMTPALARRLPPPRVALRSDRCVAADGSDAYVA
jgi:hypothetical protein